MIDLRAFIHNIESVVACHALKTKGAYRRWLTEEEATEDYNPYGCADAANILYTIGCFPKNRDEQDAMVATLQGLQDPKTGLFFEKTHHEIHTTAHCIAALELFDALPLHPLIALNPYKSIEGLLKFLEELEWGKSPWNASHKGAGVFAALTIANEVETDWQQAYFNWILKNSDHKTGFLRKGFINCESNDKDIFPHLAGTFHYLFNMEHAKQAIKYPKSLIDSCLTIFESKAYPLGKSIGFAEIDWVYCLTRSLQQCHHRFDESLTVLKQFATNYCSYLKSLDHKTDKALNDLHALFGTICCLAELQRTLPGFIITDRPLKLVLDRRPFI